MELPCNVGGIVCITLAPENSKLWGGFVLGQDPSVDGFMINKGYIIRIPTRVERPDLDFIDDFTPVLFRGALDKEHSQAHCSLLKYLSM